MSENPPQSKKKRKVESPETQKKKELSREVEKAKQKAEQADKDYIKAREAKDPNTLELLRIARELEDEFRQKDRLFEDLQVREELGLPTETPTIENPEPTPEPEPRPEPAPQPESTPEPTAPSDGASLAPDGRELAHPPTGGLEKQKKPRKKRESKKAKESTIAEIDKEIAEINDRLHSDVIQGWSNVQKMHKRRADLVKEREKLTGAPLPKKEITMKEVDRHIEEARNAARGRNRGLGPMDESPYQSIMPSETTPDGREVGGGEDYWLGIKKELEAKKRTSKKDKKESTSNKLEENIEKIKARIKELEFALKEKYKYLNNEVAKNIKFAIDTGRVPGVGPEGLAYWKNEGDKTEQEIKELEKELKKLHKKLGISPELEPAPALEPKLNPESKLESAANASIKTAEEIVGETKIHPDATEAEPAQPEKEKDKPVGPEFKSTLRSYFDKFKDLFKRKEAATVSESPILDSSISLETPLPPEPPTPEKTSLRDRWDMLRTVRVVQLGNWFKERAKSLFIPMGSKDIPIPTIIGGETVQAEQLRRGTKYATQNVEAYSTLIQNEILVDKKSGQILDSSDAEEIAQEFVALEKGRGKEFTPEEFSALIEVAIKTRIRDNNETINRIVGYTMDTLKERLAKARGQATSESVLTEGKLAEIEEQLRTKLNELRNRRIALDAKALTKVMREVLDRKYWARYLYDLTKLLVIGGIIAYKYSGDRAETVSTTEKYDIDLPIEKKMEWMDHNLWVTSKKLLHEAGVANPTDTQTQAVDTVLSVANNVKVIDPETGNVIWSQTINGQIIDRLMQPGFVDATQASQLAKEIATGTVIIP